jgi:hypothetical protein
MRKSTLIVGGGLVAALIVGTGSGAYAKSLITGSDIKNGTITGADVKDGSLGVIDLSSQARAALHGAKGATGATGAKGATGAQGAPGKNGVDGTNGKDGADGTNGKDGKDATYQGAQWAVVDRNVMGNGDASLGGSTQTPPAGVGALHIRVGSSADKTAFGDEQDFAGLDVASLTTLKYSVYTTAENNALAPNNMPGLAIEIDPNVVNSGNYTSLVYAPDNSKPYAWSTLDAVNDPAPHWGLTGSFFQQAGRCGLNGPRCTFSEVLAYLASANDSAQGPAKVLTVQITKGRDYAFSGMVDALVVNDTLYDFEPLGVVAHPQS